MTVFEVDVKARALEVGALVVDVESYRVTFAERVLDLSRTQVELLALLLRNAHRVMSRNEISDALGLQRGRSVDVLLSGLRRLLGVDFVRNVRARGWILEPSALGQVSSPLER